MGIERKEWNISAGALSESDLVWTALERRKKKRMGYRYGVIRRMEKNSL